MFKSISELVTSIFEFVKLLVKGYSYTKYEHCNDPKLLAIVEDFKQQNFNKVEETLLAFSADYREFAFNSLGEVEDTSIIEKWIQQSPNNDTAQVVLAHHKVVQAWILRGIGSIDSVDEDDLKKFKSLVQQAKEILLKSKQSPSEFDINKDVCLLTLLRGVDLDNRDIIHQTFQHGLSIDPQHIGLHIAYFVVISEKWGGTQEELSAYFEKMPNEPALLGQCILSIYYWDLIKVYQLDDDETVQKIKDFIMQIDKEGVSNDNLYRYPLYLRLYWLASIHIEGLESKYYQLVKPHWEDK